MSEQIVTAKPRLMSRIGWTSSAVVLIAFVLVALFMKKDNAGASFGDKDQVATVIIGVILAGLCIMPTRPRLYADEREVRLRAFLGPWRTIPWDLVTRVEFPAHVRFARLVLPGEEALAIYAVQRLDKQEAVEAMRGLRRLFAATHPVAG